MEPIQAKLSIVADKLHLKTEDLNLEEHFVCVADVNRPALQLNGFYEHFEADRIQMIGMVEHAYMNNKTAEERAEIYRKLLSYDIPCVIFCRGFVPEQSLMDIAHERKIPILGTAVTEYGVALDIDNFDGLVGTNVSGTSDLAPLDQQAAMLNELFPDAKTVGLLYCSAEANSQYQVDTVKVALEDLGYTCEYYAFSDSNDISSVVTNAVADSDVIYVPTDNTAASNTEIINNICLPAKVPVITGEEGICSGCGVATLSISYYDLGKATGEMAVKILKDGEDISTMPIEYAPNFTKEYNADICAELGIEVPDDYVAIGADAE